MLASFVGNRLALNALRFLFEMYANSSAWALSTIVACSIVLANATTLALFAKVTTVLMNAPLTISTLVAAYLVVNAFASSTAINAVPFVLAMRTIWWHWIA